MAPSGDYLWTSMGESLRRACPCLETLWQRIFSEKKTPPGGAAAGAEDGGCGGYSRSDCGACGEESARTPGSLQPETVPDSGAIYTALWAFDARHEDELSFKEGDLFSVVRRSGDWWTARQIDKNGRVIDTGIVPNNYLARAESLEMQL